MEVLNLYASLGGNRLKWKNCNVTAVELDPELAKLYKKRFPNDTVIIEDAHEYLINNYQRFQNGLIWSSPPCPSHSRARYWGCGSNGSNPVYPDLKLYEEIIFLQHHAKGKWVVENVIPYYEPLIPATKIERHLFWSNFRITKPKKIRKSQVGQGENEVQKLCKFHDYDFYQYKGEQRLNKIARNLVDYEIGEHIFNLAQGIHKSNNEKQLDLFNNEKLQSL
jgi:DNA (cytosine-5)-methyltransferase 1